MLQFANYYGDFWPLTSWSRDTTVWMAWQFDRPEAGEGVLQVFRRHDSPYETARLRLRGLEPESRYAFARVEEPASTTVWSGRDLLEQGLPVTIAEQPGAAVLVYSKR